jgi:membrane fusion protein, heavy metal efflux system
MKHIHYFIRISIFASLLIIAKASLAHGDHDAPTPIQSAASPRVEAHSDLFEIVATYSQEAGKERMIVFLDRYATNEPIRDAKIEVEVSAVFDGRHKQRRLKTVVTI